MTDLVIPPAKPRLPLPPLVDLLTDVHGYLRLDHAHDRPWLDDPGKNWVVFLPGHGKGNAETADVAVILPELVRALHPRLTPAVAGEAAERATLALTGMMSLPALVFLRGDRLLGSIPRVRDWDDYLQRIGEILEGTLEGGAA
ncbi:hydrogenase-1 operon protein HyaE [Azospirillum lipoferum]|uniref:Hydrogenase n=1 Tax=Azospirillum lipoferum TaxID=193 RepID=A0A5A9GJ86_AZOLI|nr:MULTISPECIES: hydrogenase [Azospirillum]KAA0594436.1 hydrogenase [Azospirillum lipoferum]MCP1613180.1 hydrogenase-1 operon protein HyaE [Azospirillum lipoferum]MDW5531380.1 hydrogenase [Azospirillum sp. NL1]